VVIFAPRRLSVSVSGLIGRSFMRLHPVIVTSLFDTVAKAVKNLTAVPALPKWILPGDFVASFLSPCCM